MFDSKFITGLVIGAIGGIIGTSVVNKKVKDAEKSEEKK